MYVVSKMHYEVNDSHVIHHLLQESIVKKAKKGFESEYQIARGKSMVNFM